MIPTNFTARAAETIRPIERLDLPIRQGDRAPFAGVLLPVNHYKQNSECLQTLPKCEYALNESIQSGMSFGDYAITFGLGSIFGLLLYVAIKH